MSSVLVGTDTDLLVMLIDKVASENINMQHSVNNVYNVHNMQKLMHSLSRRHILLAHAIKGCDTVSALFGIGKKKSLGVLEGINDSDLLDVYKKCIILVMMR